MIERFVTLSPTEVKRGPALQDLTRERINLDEVVITPTRRDL
jgi:hypothetical protein